MSIVSVSLDDESSKLYHLEPVNIGTMFCESLTGYIARLAQKHLMNVGQLINYNLVPIVNKEYLNRIAVYGGTRFYNHASMLNSVGKAAFQFAEAMQSLTLRQELIRCTFYPWQHIIPSRHLISPIKKWCPLCYQDTLNTGEVYESLIWSLQCVTVCLIHGKKLITNCPYCKKDLRILDRCMRPGFCSYCKQWLGNYEDTDDASIDEMAIAKQAANILSCSNEAHHARKEYITHFLNQCASRLSGKITEFAQSMGIPKTTLWDWCKGKNLPPFPQLLQICMRLNVNILDVVFGKNTDIQINIPKVVILNFSKQEKRQAINKYELQELLSRYIQSDIKEPVSMRGVARGIKIPRKAIEKHFPDLCKTISSKYVSFKRNQATNKKGQRKIEIRKICDQLIRQGIFPSRRNVESLASWKAALRNPELQKEWKSIVYGFSLSNS